MEMLRCTLLNQRKLITVLWFKKEVQELEAYSSDASDVF